MIVTTAIAGTITTAMKPKENALRFILPSLCIDKPICSCANPPISGGGDDSSMFELQTWKSSIPRAFSEIARVFFVHPIVPMFMYTKTAASDA